MTIAEFYASQPPMTAGTVAITAFDDESIAAGSLPQAAIRKSMPMSVTTFSSSFDATICLIRSSVACRCAPPSLLGRVRCARTQWYTRNLHHDEAEHLAREVESLGEPAHGG